MMEFLASGIATVDVMRDAMRLREVALAKIARARYVRDIMGDVKAAVDFGVKLKAIKGAIHVGGK